MSSAPNVTPQEPSSLAAVLSYLIPGLGQIYQGRYGKGVLFMVSLLGMFLLGQAMGKWQNVYVPDARNQPGGRGNLISGLMIRWHYGGQFWIGIAAWPALWQHYGMTVPEKDTNPFWHNFQKTPEESEVNNFLRISDKTPDLGWVYTVIAGMLNLLVIYDAYVGPLPIPPVWRGAKESFPAKTEVTKEAAV
ncbi:MAG: hypothetical protein EXR98_16650 [Gemmataceae bacterium]|nr:hypothetical protein [Gemmataceae bacterium]